MRILVRGTNWIGDAVMTIPALRRLRSVFPTSEITLAAKPWTSELLGDADFVDRFVDVSPGRSLRATRKQASSLRKTGFDLGILFTNSFHTALVFRLARIPRTFGYRNEGRSFLITDSFRQPRWKNTRHEIHYYLRVVREVEQRIIGEDIQNPDQVPDSSLPVSEERRNEAKLLLKSLGVEISKPIFALGAGSTNSRAKRWPAERFALLNDRIQGETGAEVILLGSENETEIAGEVVKKSRFPPHVLTGKTTVGQATGVLATVDGFVSNDMGLAPYIKRCRDKNTNRFRADQSGDHTPIKFRYCAGQRDRLCPVYAEGLSD